jgi:hypothetical protein
MEIFILFICFQQVERYTDNKGGVFSGMAGSFLALIFMKNHVECPGQAIFNAPVTTDVAVKSTGICRKAADVVPDF